ncbi:hypothetical protein LKR43_02610 [Pusillimonas sp. MFBS29]|uniref:hypothetical protein n=1 Tax=Pusillimonas sp. MFBS29 TaxID=2886690 RepID=UPI001D10963B|nr:hypothetical protein [Pusillimonas sp. MFBS29]MCC2595223.1 hypothetical protein [Pusillimonas sp. MFBS29]
MEAYAPHPDQLVHIRIILGVIMGLSLTRLLAGLAMFVQHAGRERVYPVHMGWVLFLFFAVIHFWWFQFSLHGVVRWSFKLYLFLIFYAALFFLICTILFPDRKEEHLSFADYFHSRQKWFYGLLAALFTVDVFDTLWKGIDHFHALGTVYLARQSIMILLCLTAIFVRNRYFHYFFVVCALTAQILWIVRYYQFLY